MHSESSDARSLRTALILYYVFKLAQVACCGTAIFLGYHLFIAGVSGHASLSIESQKVSGQLLNAAPGLFFAVGGIVGLLASIIKGVEVSLGQPRGSLLLQTLGRGTRIDDKHAGSASSRKDNPNKIVDWEARSAKEPARPEPSP